MLKAFCACCDLTLRVAPRSPASGKCWTLDFVAITTHFSVKVPTLRVSGSELVPLNPTVDVPGGQPRFFLLQSDLEEVLTQLTQLSIDN